MFQNAWFDKKEYNGQSFLFSDVPNSFITTEQIDEVATLYWDEHCLECSAPACYSSCLKYLPRKDKLCKRLYYGIKHSKPPMGLLWNVRFRFRQWGKLEARINKGTLPPKELQLRSSRDYLKTGAFKIASAVLSPSARDISTKWDGLKRNKYASLPSRTLFANDFLFQYYSHEEHPYRMNFEITNNENTVIYKYGMEISTGYHQELLTLEFIPPEGGLVRIYPEGNIQAEITLFALDFVKLKNAIPSRPSKKIKCIAWDLDNTIWSGILAESQPDDLILREGVLDIIREFDRRGIIQIVISKNDTGTPDQILEKLGIRQYFIYVLANWNSKSTNIFLAARMLNINVDTFGLIDDSDFERREVSETLPCIRVYSEDVDTILENPEFDVPVTGESRNRRLSYLQEASRKNVLLNSFSGNNIDFIKNCEIDITVKRIENKEEFQRSYELLQRTNQLNLSANRYNESDFENLLHNAGETLIAFVKDRYGDYGQVAFLHFEIGEHVVISEFAMSCRVAGKYVEAALFQWLLQKFGKGIEMIGNKTTRNQTLIDALIKCGFQDCSNTENAIHVKLPAMADVPFASVNSVTWLR